jgi:hypothetical protein
MRAWTLSTGHRPHRSYDYKRMPYAQTPRPAFAGPLAIGVTNRHVGEKQHHSPKTEIYYVLVLRPLRRGRRKDGKQQRTHTNSKNVHPCLSSHRPSGAQRSCRAAFPSPSPTKTFAQINKRELQPLRPRCAAERGEVKLPMIRTSQALKKTRCPPVKEQVPNTCKRIEIATTKTTTTPQRIHAFNAGARIAARPSTRAWLRRRV